MFQKSEKRGVDGKQSDKLIGLDVAQERGRRKSREDTSACCWSDAERLLKGSEILINSNMCIILKAISNHMDVFVYVWNFLHLLIECLGNKMKNYNSFIRKYARSFHTVS